MALSLPTTPAPSEVTPRKIDASGSLSSAFGAGDQRLERMGTRWALDVTMPPMRYVDAQEFSDLEAQGTTCIFPIPQPGLNIGTPGVGLVDGAGQSGSTLSLKNLTPNYAFKRWQWITVITSGVRYCYRAASAAVVASDGTIDLPLSTMLRKPHADEDVVKVSDPEIEGFVTLPEDAWKVGRDRLVYLRFTIQERV
jgi:hypothetical protein